MAYQSLYRRYRPQRFAELRGQEHLVRALRNAVREGRVGDAYMLSGPRGTGKTSTARILAKALNCEHVVDGEPCGECESCKAIELGSSFDVFELDAASNNGVDAIRDLVAKAALGTPGRTKVYILDEVHMLSTAASNALLKTLEEPPDHVVFVLATTDPQKVLATIKSRTQHFEVHLLAASELEELVRHVIDDAGLDVSNESIDYVVRAGAGSARDTLSALDQVVAAGGAPQGAEVLDELVEALCDRDTGRALVAIESATARGYAPRVIGEQLIARLRDVFLASLGASLERLTDQDRERCVDQAERLTAAGSTRALEALGDAFVGIQDAPDQRVVLEVALVRLTHPELDTSPGALVERLARLERGIASGAAVAIPPASVDAAPAVSREPSGESPAESADGPVVVGAGSPSPVSTAGGPTEGPAAAARQVLAQKRAETGRSETRRSRSSARADTPAPPSADAPAPRQPPTEPPASAPAPPPPPAPSAQSVGAALPTIDELTRAWSETLLSKLGRAKPRYSGGRWIDVVDGVAVYGLPNEIHAAKCDEVRDIVEAVLAEHFSRPIPMRIVVDTGDAAARTSDGIPATRVDPDEDVAIDLEELTDAVGDAPSGVDRVAEVFPGAQLVEGD